MSNIEPSDTDATTSFDSTVVPILLYGAEVWGFEDVKCLETMELKFFKHILGVKPRTPSAIVYGELGRYPLNILIKMRLVNYWAKLVKCKETKITGIIYGIMLNLHIQNQYHSKWITAVESIFNETGLSYIWRGQTIVDMEWLSRTMKNTLQGQFIQSWYGIIGLFNYKLIKQQFCFEMYLDRLPYKKRKILTKFRCNNHRLPVESKRFEDVDEI